MALVAYSDNSDMGSDSEEEEETLNDKKNQKIDKEKPPTDPPKNVIPKPSGVETIVDEDDDYAAESVPSSGLFSSVPAPVPVMSLLPAGGEEVEDEVVDVPTVETWKVTQDLKKLQNNNEGGPPTAEPRPPTTQKKAKKVKILIPSLSEFADDDDDEEVKEPPKKKVNPSRSGSGLFSVLPEPKNVSAKEAKRSLVPHVLTKRPTQTQKPARKVTKKPPPAATSVAGNVSDDDDDEPLTGTSDFFSLSEEPDTQFGGVVPEAAPTHVMAGIAPTLEPLREEPRVPSTHPEGPSPSMVQHYEQVGPSTMVQEPPQPEAATTAAVAGIDEATLMRLAGKRGRADAINFIDVNADDALLTRQEWMTKALSEEKPQHGFSKKREGLPTQKQKQKHQITYLAHQAKERELDLKNTWALNKMTKMQSQAKYGF